MRILKYVFSLITLLILLPHIVFALTSPPPVLNFSDITSGPKSGNTDGMVVVHGAIVTIWGNNLGSSQGNSKVYFRDSAGNSYEAAHIYYWKNADGQKPSGPADLYSYHKMQEIAFSIPSSASQGIGSIYVEVDGLNSITLPFTVRSGNIYYVKTTGNDATGDGSWNKPWASLNYVSLNGAKGLINAGDIIYAGDGLLVTNELRVSDALDGTAKMPISMITYPGSKVNIYGANGAIRNSYGDADYWNFAKFVVGAVSNGINTFKEGRIIGNEITNEPGKCADGQNGAISGNNSGERNKYTTSGVKALGNYIHHFGCDNTSVFHHVFYITNRGGVKVKSFELGWNFLKDNKAYGALHVYDHAPCGDWDGPMNIHNNVVLNQRGKAFGINTGGCPGDITMDINVYNNLFINTGLGPALRDGILYPVAVALSGAHVKSHIRLYHNTIYGYSEDVSGISGSTKKALAVEHAGTWEWRNNIVFDTKNLPFGGGKNPIISTNNLWYNGGDGNPASPPSWDSSPITSDPLFVNPQSNNFSLSASSLAKDAGVYVGIDRDFFGNLRVSNPDIGAIEFFENSTDTIPPAKPTNLRVP